MSDFLIDLLKKTRLGGAINTPNQYYIPGKREDAGAISTSLAFGNTQIYKKLPEYSEVESFYLSTENNIVLNTENDNKLTIE